jgi:hypothetical protein
MLYAGLNLCRKRVDVCVLDVDGVIVAELAAPPDRPTAQDHVPRRPRRGRAAPRRVLCANCC